MHIVFLGDDTTLSEELCKEMSFKYVLTFIIKKTKKTRLITYTANIFNVVLTVFTCVPFSNVIPLYGLHLITAPCTVEKCKH